MTACVHEWVDATTDILCSKCGASHELEAPVVPDIEVIVKELEAKLVALEAFWKRRGPPTPASVDDTKDLYTRILAVLRAKAAARPPAALVARLRQRMNFLDRHYEDRDCPPKMAAALEVYRDVLAWMEEQ